MNRLWLFCIGCSIAVSTWAQPNTPAPNPTALSDEFDSAASLQNWRWAHDTDGWANHMQRAAVNANGQLEMEPGVTAWYAELNAPLLYKEVTGDFDVRARLRVDGLTGPVPTRLWSLAGLMVRAPRRTRATDWQPKEENWLFITTGVAYEAGKPVFETKSTTNSISNLKVRPARSGWLELRVVRSGPSFLLLYRFEGQDAWTLHERMHRVIMPRTLQVGLICYTDYLSAEQDAMQDYKKFNNTIYPGQPDLRLTVDYVRFAPSPLPGHHPFENPYTDYAYSNDQLLQQLGR